MRTIVEVLAEPGPVPPIELPAAVAQLIDLEDPATLWLALSVLRAEFPDMREMEAARRLARIDGPRAVVSAALADLAGQDGPLPSVHVIQGAVTVDVHHTSTSEYVSGIQRVVQETVSRWGRRHTFYPVAWTRGFGAFRPLSSDEVEHVFGTARGLTIERRTEADDEVWIPWRGRHVLPELGAEADRSRRLLALAAVSGTELSAIGHDCIPVTTSETVSSGVGGLFAGYLAALRHADRIATTSVSSSTEFAGWRRMLRAAGFPGPDLAEIPLAIQPRSPTAAQLDAARNLLSVPSLPIVLVVGSHEPRKNHLAVLHAAELLWRAGLSFNLVFVGTGSWGADAFRAEAAELATAGRPIEVMVGLPDELLWAAYSLARCVVFPSLNEGFGLPIAESIAAGTPVVTSEFGSMREILAPGGDPKGGVLVDPFDDDSIADGIRILLTDEQFYDRARAEASARAERTWDQYAVVAWDYLVSGRSTK